MATKGRPTLASQGKQRKPNNVSARESYKRKRDAELLRKLERMGHMYLHRVARWELEYGGHLTNTVRRIYEEVAQETEWALTDAHPPWRDPK